MRGNWKTISSNGRYKLLASHDDLPVPLLVQPLRSARRLRLRFDAARGLLKLTCPSNVSRRSALAWAAEQRAWIDEQLATVLPGNPYEPGSTIPLEGRDVRIVWDEALPRAPRLRGDTLQCGGPSEGLGRRIERFLKRHALDVLSRETAEIAGAAGLAPKAVAIGDADTRWGSCSSQGRIRYSWRLILAPPEARRYVVAHEIAHLRHLDHGPQFRALERQLYGCDPGAARALLRVVGPRLKRVGRGG